MDQLLMIFKVFNEEKAEPEEAKQEPEDSYH